MKIITITVAILGFLLFRPYLLQNSTILYSGDDQNYFAHASAMVFGQFPDYRHEDFVWGGKIPLHSIGSAVLAYPFVWGGSLIDRLHHNSITQERTRNNIRGSWSLFGFILSSQVYLWVSCLILFQSLKLFVREKTAAIAILFSVLLQGIPLYVFRRPVFSHIYEFFLQALLFSFLLYGLRHRKTGDLSLLKLVLLGILCALVFLVRYNNAVFAFTWPLVIVLFCYPNVSQNQKMKWLGVIYSISMAVVLLFLVYPWLYNNWANSERSSLLYGNLNSNMLQPLIPTYHFLFQLPALIGHMFFSIDWGLCYTAPFFVFGLAFLILGRYPFKKQCLVASLPLLVNFWVALSWIPKWQQGTWYGYRFVIFSGIPIILYPFACLLENKFQKLDARTILLMSLLGLFPFFSMMLFDGNSTTLTLSTNNSVNETYQLNVWKTIASPEEFLTASCKGGPLYAVYLTALLFHQEHRLPAIVMEKYPSFNEIVLVKSAIIYSLPLFLHILFGLKCANKQVVVLTGSTGIQKTNGQ